MYHVPLLSVIFMGISLIGAFAIPIALFVYFKVKKGAEVLPFFVGCAVMIVFAFILERIVHTVVLGSTAGETIQGNIWLYALYGGLMAGIFEETGRFAAFKTVLRKMQYDNNNALMYGAGHGGIEAIMILGIASINNLIYSVLLNLGRADVLTAPLAPEMAAMVEQTFNTLCTTPSYQFLLGLVERIFAVVVHLSLSVLVWFAVKNKQRRILYPCAILMHAVLDGVTVILSHYISVVAVEAGVGVMAVICAFVAKLVWKRENAAEAAQNSWRESGPDLLETR